MKANGETRIRVNGQKRERGEGMIKQRNPEATCATCPWLFYPEPTDMGGKMLTPYPQCRNERNSTKAVMESDRDFCSLHPDQPFWTRLMGSGR